MTATSVLGVLLSAFLSGFLLPLAKSWLGQMSQSADLRREGAQDVIVAAANDAAGKESGYAEILARDRGRGAVVGRLRDGPAI